RTRASGPGARRRAAAPSPLGRRPTRRTRLLSCFTFPGDLEERGAQDEPRGKNYDQPGDDDADERPALAPRRLTQRLDEDPAQEAGVAYRRDTVPRNSGSTRLLAMP